MSRYEPDGDDIDYIIEVTTWEIDPDLPENDVEWSDYDKAAKGDDDDVQG